MLPRENYMFSLKPRYVYLVIILSPFAYLITLGLRVYQSTISLQLEGFNNINFSFILETIKDAQSTILIEIASRLNANYGEKVLSLLSLHELSQLANFSGMFLNDIKSFLNMLLPSTPFPDVLPGTSPYLTLATGVLNSYPFYKTLDDIIFDLNTSPFSFFGYLLVLTRNHFVSVVLFSAALIVLGLILNAFRSLSLRVFATWFLFAAFNMFGLDVSVFNSLCAMFAFTL